MKTPMLNIKFGTGAVGAGSRYGSGSTKMMRLLAAPAPQHCLKYPQMSCDNFPVYRLMIFGEGTFQTTWQGNDTVYLQLPAVGEF
jgi:hypothetical protein